ncbi:hypothetical protein D3C78_1114420 [compost metagenome]
MQAEVVGEHRLGGEGIAPAQRRPLAQGAAGGEHRGEHAEQQDHAALPGRARLLTCGRGAGGRGRPGQSIQPLEQQEHQGAQQPPGQQQAHHREAVPEHAQHRRRVFAQVLEHQAVQPLVELPVEVQFDHAEQDGQAGAGAQPVALGLPRGHRAHAEQGQQQRRADVHGHAQVEAQAVAEGFDEAGQRRRADQLAVVDQQGQTQQGEQGEQAQGAGGGEGEVLADPDGCAVGGRASGRPGGWIHGDRHSLERGTDGAPGRLAAASGAGVVDGGAHGARRCVLFFCYRRDYRASG